MSTSDFRHRLRAARPDIAQRESGNEVKRKLALALRALRKSRGMTQRELEQRSGMTQPVISRLEAPDGPLPNWDTVLRYVEACDGHMMLGFSLGAFDEEGLLRQPPGNAAGGLVSAVAV